MCDFFCFLTLQNRAFIIFRAEFKLMTLVWIGDAPKHFGEAYFGQS